MNLRILITGSAGLVGRALTRALSNVYGSVYDHADRVVPAFARAAAHGGTLRVDGAGHTFDFTHIDDTIRGLSALIELLAAGDQAPPRSFDVSHFYGDPGRARALLGWTPRVSPREGLNRLIRGFRRALGRQEANAS